MYNPTVKWSNSPSLNVNKYLVQWSRNGVAAGLQNVIVPQNYAFWNDVNSSVVLLAGDVIGATVTADDTVNNLLSTPVVATTLTIPSTPPMPPTNVVLSLT